MTARAAVLLAFLAFPAAADNITGPAQAKDGDSLYVQGREIRLYGVDAPEWGQACTLGGKKWMAGREAAAWLKSMVDGKVLSCDRALTDRYRRAVSVCYVDGRDLGAESVRAGWSRAYCADPPACERYSGRYLDDESAAKTAKHGIWKGECESPWEWRERKRAPK